MMVTCIARNRTCLIGLAKVVEDAIYYGLKDQLNKSASKVSMKRNSRKLKSMLH